MMSGVWLLPPSSGVPVEVGAVSVGASVLVCVSVVPANEADSCAAERDAAAEAEDALAALTDDLDAEAADLEASADWLASAAD